MGTTPPTSHPCSLAPILLPLPQPSLTLHPHSSIHIPHPSILHHVPLLPFTLTLPPPSYPSPCTPQGAVMGWLASAGSLARIVFPLLAGVLSQVTPLALPIYISHFNFFLEKNHLTSSPFFDESLFPCPLPHPIPHLPHTHTHTHRTLMTV